MVLCCFPVSQNVMCGKLRIHKETNFMYSDECELHPPIMNGTTLKPSKRKYQMCQMIEAMSMHYGKSDDLAKVYKRLKKGSAGFTHIERTHDTPRFTLSLWNISPPPHRWTNQCDILFPLLFLFFIFHHLCR